MAFMLAGMKARMKSVRQARQNESMKDCNQSCLPDCKIESLLAVMLERLPGCKIDFLLACLHEIMLWLANDYRGRKF